MSDLEPFAGRPVLLTHWDGDVYPRAVIPPLQELLVYLLAYGNVEVREVDVFLTDRIAKYFTEDLRRKQLRSLLDTRRIKVLIPEERTAFDVPVDKHPITATALERVRNKRPFKDRPWNFSRSVQEYCRNLDDVVAGATQHRQPYRPENTFISKLRSVLEQKDELWRSREPFRDISPADIEGLRQLSKDESVYRSAIYAHTKRGEGRAVSQGVRNLAQSVWAYCELGREGAIGTYQGKRIAEIPPTELVDTPPLSIPRVVPLPGHLDIPACCNVGEIVTNVLAECGKDLRTFWSVQAGGLLGPQAFRQVWDHVNDAFRRFSATAERVVGSTVFLGPSSHVIRVALILNSEGAVISMRWLNEASDAASSKVPWRVSAIQPVDRTTASLIRQGRAYDPRLLGRTELRAVLLNSDTVRGSPIE